MNTKGSTYNGQPAAHVVDEEQQRGADQQLADQERHRLAHAELAAGQRPEARALDMTLSMSRSHMSLTVQPMPA